MRVQIVDVPAWTPPYDHALCAALAGAGANVELVTTKFPFGPVPFGDGYAVSERFYRQSARLYAQGVHAGRARQSARRAVKLAEHVPDMLSYGRHARAADVVHYQWLTFPALDVHLLPRRRPRVLTAHDVPPREPRWGELRAFGRLLRRMDAVVVHSEHGARRLRDELAAPPELVHVIPHGAFDYLTRLPGELPLSGELANVDRPVVLFFGLIRAYKGLDVLLEAFASVPDAELWIVGLPRLALEPFERLARAAPGRVRFISRYVADVEIPAFLRRADLVVLPYREVDQSGVLHAALAFGKPLVLSRIGGFIDMGNEHGAARLVEPGDAAELGVALQELLGDPAERHRLGAAAAAAAAGPYSWDNVAQRTLRLYQELLRNAGSRYSM